jgi:transposase
MSLQPMSVPAVPEQTARVARAAFPSGNLYMKMRDEFGVFFTDAEFADLFPRRGQPAEAPWRLALVCVMQFAEGLTDRQAAEAVRSRIDWKYALSLELEAPGFDSSVLCEFRARLLAGGADGRLFETLLARFDAHGLLKKRGRQRTDSTHVLAAIRGLNRLETLGETMRSALNCMAQVAPEWLLTQTPPEWFDRYSHRMEGYRLPAGKAQRETLAVTIGEDGFRLLQALLTPQAPPFLKTLPAVQILWQVWFQQFYREGEQVRLRTEEEMPPCAKRIISPYDQEARFSTKRETQWTGYKLHLTETCDADRPHLITQVETTPSTTADNLVTTLVQASLAQADRLPSEHLVDEGYTQAAHLISSRTQYGIQLVGPLAQDQSWQARQDNGFAPSSFTLDWETQRALCPGGKQSRPWREARTVRGNVFWLAVFETADCRRCTHQPQCTRSQSRGRTLSIPPQEEQQALLTARTQQQTQAFRLRYAARAGIEGTLSQGVRAFGLRRSRYVGHAKTHLQHLIVAASLNFCRVFEWLMEVPLAKTRQSHFARLKAEVVHT